MNRSFFILLAVWAYFNCTVARAETVPVVCDTGQQLKTRILNEEDVKFVFCVDERKMIQGRAAAVRLADGSIETVLHYVDGELHGLAQTFAPDGTLLHESRYEHGNVQSEHLTEALLQRIVDDLNAGFVARKKAVKLKLLPGRVLEYSLFRSRGEAFLLEQKAEQRQLAHDHICRLFSGKHADLTKLTSVQVRLYDQDQTEIMHFSIVPEDCSGE